MVSKSKVRFLAIWAALLPMGGLYSQSLISNPEVQDREKNRIYFLASPGNSKSFLGYHQSLFEGQESQEISVALHYTSYHEKALRVSGVGSMQYPVFRRTLLPGANSLPLREKENFWGRGRVKFRLTDWFGAELNIDVGRAINAQQFWYRIQNLYGQIRWRKLVLTVGRKPNLWGPSFVSPLILGSNGQSMDLIQLSTLPVEPWSFLKFLGKFKSEIFVSRMSKNRILPNDYFFGWRIGIQPWPTFELNASTLYQFGGRGSLNATTSDVFVEFLGGRVEKQVGHETKDLSNRSVSVDIRKDFPHWGVPISIYSEHHFEDCCGSWGIFESAYSYTYGAAILMAKPSRTLLQVEYTKTAYTIYRHGRWKSALSNEGAILGHTLGRDAQGVYLKGGSDWRGLSLRTEATLAWEERFRRSRFPETRLMTIVNGRLALSRRLDVLASFGSVYIFQKDSKANRNVFEWAADVSLTYTWR